MMKFYSKPEIEALALETVDVIATSGNRAALKELQDVYTGLTADQVQEFGSVVDLADGWQW